MHENHLDKNEARWFAVYTNYKREKLVEKMLHNKGIECYLPIQKVVRRYTRKIKTIELPLINCYVFVKIKQQEYITVLETEYVLKFTRIAKNLISIPDQEIDVLKRVVGEEMEIEAMPKTILPGSRVEVIAGNLTGLKGTLVSIEGKKQMLIDLDNIGYSLRMKIDTDLLQIIENQ